MKRLLERLAQIRKRWALTPEQAETLAKIKKPCC